MMWVALAASYGIRSLGSEWSGTSIINGILQSEGRDSTGESWTGHSAPRSGLSGVFKASPQLFHRQHHTIRSTSQKEYTSSLSLRRRLQSPVAPALMWTATSLRLAGITLIITTVRNANVIFQPSMSNPPPQNVRCPCALANE